MAFTFDEFKEALKFFDSILPGKHDLLVITDDGSRVIGRYLEKPVVSKKSIICLWVGRLDAGEPSVSKPCHLFVDLQAVNSVGCIPSS